MVSCIIKYKYLQWMNDKQCSSEFHACTFKSISDLLSFCTNFMFRPNSIASSTCIQTRFGLWLSNIVIYVIMYKAEKILCHIVYINTIYCFNCMQHVTTAWTKLKKMHVITSFPDKLSMFSWFPHFYKVWKITEKIVKTH